jgi:hypothetical protein
MVEVAPLAPVIIPVGFVLAAGKNNRFLDDKPYLDA